MIRSTIVHIFRVGYSNAHIIRCIMIKLIYFVIFMMLFLLCNKKTPKRLACFTIYDLAELNIVVCFVRQMSINNT